MLRPLDLFFDNLCGVSMPGPLELWQEQLANMLRGLSINNIDDDDDDDDDDDVLEQSLGAISRPRCCV